MNKVRIEVVRASRRGCSFIKDSSTTRAKRGKGAVPDKRLQVQTRRRKAAEKTGGK